MRRRVLAEIRWRGEALMIGKVNNRNKAACAAFQRFKSKCSASSFSGCAEDKVQGCDEKVGSLQAKEKVGSLRAKVCVPQMGDASLLCNTTAWWSHVNEHLLESKKHMAALQEEMVGVLRDIAFIRSDVNSHIAAVEVLFSSLRADITKGQREQMRGMVKQHEHALQDMEMLRDRVENHFFDIKNGMKTDMTDIGTQIATLDQLSKRLRYVLADLALGRALDEQLMSKIEAYRADVEEVVGSSNPVRFGAASSILGSFFKGEIAILTKYMSRIDANMHVLGQGRDQMDKLILRLVNLSDDPSNVSPEIKDLLSRVDESLKGLQEDLHRQAVAGVQTARENTTQLASLESKIDIMNKYLWTLFKKMHGEVEQMRGIVEIANTSANGAWSGVIAQEKCNMETMQKVLSVTESNASNKEHANIVLVKVVSVFLACTIGLHAWTVWSFNSCYLL